jgi:hypothetical protein
VALSQHNIRIVPAQEMMTKRNTVLNVPSGTCLDHTVTPFLDGLNLSAPLPENDRIPDDPIPLVFSNPTSSGFDFLLTAHGGLKGTSKPIFYRVVSPFLFYVDSCCRGTNSYCLSDSQRKLCLAPLVKW